MAKAVRLDAEAEEEIGAAIDWYERERPGLGGEFLEEVRDALDSLRVPGPECRAAIGVPPELRVRRKLLRRFPYLLLFIEFDAVVRVIAVAHARRRPGYWLSRV